LIFLCRSFIASEYNVEATEGHLEVDGYNVRVAWSNELIVMGSSILGLAKSVMAS